MRQPSLVGDLTAAAALWHTGTIPAKGGDIMGRTHYIAMAGLNGYLPNYCEGLQTYEDAVVSLAELHDLGKKRINTLRRDRYIALYLEVDGNEYAEVSECSCDEPWIHSEGSEIEEWKEWMQEGGD